MLNMLLFAQRVAKAAVFSFNTHFLDLCIKQEELRVRINPVCRAQRCCLLSKSNLYCVRFLPPRQVR